MGGRRRHIFVLLFVLGLVIASGVVISQKKTQLGLDLQGGIELTLQGRPTPQQPTVTNDAIERSVDLIRDGCDRLGVSEIEVTRLGTDQISVGIPGATSVGRATECATKPARLYLYDWQANLLGPAQAFNENPAQGPPADVANELRKVWREAGRSPSAFANRSLFSSGAYPTAYDAVTFASKRPARENCENCSAPDRFYLFSDDDRHRLLSGPVNSRQDLYFDEQGRPIPKGGEVIQVKQGTTVVSEPPSDPSTGDEIEGQPGWYVMRDDPALSGTNIKDPKQQTDQTTGQPNVTFEFDDEGEDAFQEVTREIAQRGQANAIGPQTEQSAAQFSGSFAIVLDNQVITRPIINFAENPDGIDGRQGAQISGNFSIGEAQDLAEFLQRGALPIDLKLTSQSQVSATLGQEALDQGTTALAIGLICVIIFLCGFYRLLGVIASVALLAYGVIFLALIDLIPITLTLPGIAGLVLTIGVAADANIVIFERIKEEARAGRSMSSAIAIGYRRGISTIIDANVVTLLTAFILFVLATAGIKGFAFTLGIGTIASLLTAVVFTQALLGTMSNSAFLRRPSMLGAAKEGIRWHFDFIGASRWFFSISGVILLIGALALAGKGLNFGIDFESGTRIDVSLQQSVTADDVRETVSPFGLDDAEIQSLENPALGDNAFQIESSTLDPAEIAQVQDALEGDYGVTADGFDSTSVGPTFGETVARSAALAVLFSLLLITGYIALRFEGKYAVPVLIAIAHDILITAGIYALIGAEVSSATVAAFLTILGYSLYDTIIVFDRIRENQPKMPRATYSQIVNRSMSGVLTRSLATSFSTLIGVAALLVFGGETLRDFALAILIGIASGTYSSIFIASPVLTAWKERELGFRRRREQQHEIYGEIPPFYEDIEPSQSTLDNDATQRPRQPEKFGSES